MMSSYLVDQRGSEGLRETDQPVTWWTSEGARERARLTNGLSPLPFGSTRREREL